MPRTARAKVRRHGAAVPSALAQKQPPSIGDAANMDEETQLTAAGETSQAASSSTSALPTPEASSSKKPLTFKAALAQSAPHPYLTLSKSHKRREKRKARSQLVGGGLSDLTAALGDIAPSELEEEDLPPDTKTKAGAKGSKLDEGKAKSKGEKGKIGEGRGRTLGEKKRREVIQDAAKRIPAVMGHPAYKQKPWATIREHVGNTLATK